MGAPFFVKEPKSLLVVRAGQSTAQDTLERSAQNLVDWPRLFASQVKPGLGVPMTPDVSVIGRGGWGPMFYDELWAAGWNTKIVTTAVGGSNLLTHWCGTVQTRVNGAIYAQRRDTPIYPDRGDFGDVLALTTPASGRYARVKSGRRRSFVNAGPLRSAGETSTIQDFYSISQTGEAAGASQPDVSSKVTGDEVTDGTLTTVMLDPSRYGSAGSISDPANIQTFSGIFGEQNDGYGGDPGGLIARTLEAFTSNPNFDERILIWEQGQSNLAPGGVGGNSVTLGRAAAVLAIRFARRGIRFVHIIPPFSPLSAGASAAGYQALVDGRDIAADLVNGFYPGMYIKGANLYALHGSTGRKGGQGVTASINSGVMTVTAVGQGTGVEVGHVVYSGKSVVGTVVSFGTGSGGVGTYNLAGGVNTASGALICAGTGLDYDGVHESAAAVVGPDFGGVANSAKLRASSIVSIIGDRRPLILDRNGNAAT